MSLDFMRYETTVATYFLVRPLGLFEKSESVITTNPNAGKIIKKYGFVQAYMKDVEHVPTTKYPVYVLFRPPNMVEFGEFIEEEKQLDLIEDVYDYPNGYVVVVYRFPEIYYNDYNLIVDGKYSETSDTFKSLFPATSLGSPSLYHLIFNKHKNLKAEIENEINTIIPDDAELWHYPDMSKETLDITKFIKMEDVK